MSRHIKWLAITVALVGSWPYQTAQAAELVLMDTPVKVTATVKALDEGGYAAQIGIHNGPIAQLVNTAVRANSQSNAERILRKQVRWQSPYLFVHSSCGGGRNLRCEGETVFKVVETVTVRLGDLIGAAPSVYTKGHFHDVYDKLDGKLGIASELTPRFVLVLDDVNGKWVVNAAATWSGNANAWRTHADQIANTPPHKDWSETEWLPYFSALVSNAALARYCNKHDELQAVLNTVTPLLNTDQLRMVTDALSKVVPLELPKAWRTPY